MKNVLYNYLLFSLNAQKKKPMDTWWWKSVRNLIDIWILAAVINCLSIESHRAL